jgi:hypothetical protein
MQALGLLGGRARTDPPQEMTPDRRRADSDGTVVVRLTQKLATVIDGIDLTNYEVGQAIALPARSARLLLAEGWAEPMDEETAR